MRAEKLISRHTLDNGLTLEFWDLSRPMVGDRWLIVLEARIAVAVGAATLPPELQGRDDGSRPRPGAGSGLCPPG